MEQICDDLKSVLLAELPVLLESAATAEIPLPSFSDLTITVGYVDLQKHNGAQELFIIPDRQSLSESTLASFEASTPVELLIVVRRADPEVLYRQCLRYASAMKKLFNGNPEYATRVVEIEYYEEVEAIKDVKAISLTLEITTEEMMEG
ncbi:MAG: hypothetical protein EWM51_03715 [Treponema sp.]|nr:MAG: hypothetical protein EWM51_03715 [Treponema sp.]